MRAESPPGTEETGWVVQGRTGTPETAVAPAPPDITLPVLAIPPEPQSVTGVVAFGASPVLPGDLALPPDPVLAETARALGYDVQSIFTFVRDSVRFVPYPGFVRGATRTLLDREGNSADQSLLLFTLLRISGHNPVLIHSAPGVDDCGGILIPIGGASDGYDGSTWLGTAADNARFPRAVLAPTGMPSRILLGNSGKRRDRALLVGRQHPWAFV